jgi:hypothetical protein
MRARLIISSLVVVLGLGSFAGQAQAAPTRAATKPPFSVTGTVVRVASPAVYDAQGALVDTSQVMLQLTNVQYFVVTGTLVNGEYQYPYRVNAAPGVVVGGIELADNHQAHTQLIAVGIPTATSAAAVDRHSIGLAPSSSSSSISPSTYSGDAPLHLIWYDPAHIWLVQVYDILHWQYDFLHVYFSSYNDYEQLVWQDGWHTDWENYSWGYGQSYHQSVWNNTSGVYENDLFCFTVTQVHVINNESIGWYDGTRTAYVNTYNSGTGSCWALIHYFWKWG